MTRKQAFQFLCNLLSVGNSTSTTACLDTAGFGWEILISVANEYLMAPAVGNALRARGAPAIMPQPIAEYFEGIAFLNRQRNSCIRAEAVFAASILNQNGVAPIFLKGAANLLSGLYADPASRFMLDIDILVPQESLAHCVAAMHREGYQTLSIPDPCAHHYAPLARPDSAVSIELHVEPLDTAYGAFLRSMDIVGSAIPLSVPGISARIPRPWCRIVQSIVHAEMSDHGLMFGTIALRELLDVALLTRVPDEPIELPLILQAFERRGSTACGYHLLAAKQLLGAEFGKNICTGYRPLMCYYRALYQVSHPRFARIVRRLLRPWLLLVRSLFHPQLRIRLLHSLSQLSWYGRQLKMLSHDPF
jgi:hypothetical protein